MNLSGFVEAPPATDKEENALQTFYGKLVEINDAKEYTIVFFKTWEVKTYTVVPL